VPSLTPSLRWLYDTMSSGEARRDIWLANYMELTIWPIVGAGSVRQFLYDLCYC
jgi:hypothetical protein